MTIIQIKSALVSAGLMAFLGLAGYIIGVGDLWKLDYHAFVNVAVMAFLTAVVSSVKSLLTDESGKALGVHVAPPSL